MRRGCDTMPLSTCSSRLIARTRITGETPAYTIKCTQECWNGTGYAAHCPSLEAERPLHLSDTCSMHQMAERAGDAGLRMRQGFALARDAMTDASATIEATSLEQNLQPIRCRRPSRVLAARILLCSLFRIRRRSRRRRREHRLSRRLSWKAEASFPPTTSPPNRPAQRGRFIPLFLCPLSCPSLLCTPTGVCTGHTDRSKCACCHTSTAPMYSYLIVERNIKSIARSIRVVV